MLLLFTSINAQSAERHIFEGELEVGVEQDSTIIVDDIDSIDESSSDGYLLKAFINYEYNASVNDKINLSANYISKDFRENDTFDNELIILSANYNHDFQRFSVGARSQIVRSDLDGESFLNIEQFSPFVSFFVSKQWFLNLSATQINKSLPNNTERSADATELNADVYRFIKGIGHYFLFSYRTRNENAQEALFSFTSNQLRIGWTKKFQWLGMENRFRVNWRFQKRRYTDELHPDIDAFRIDNRRAWDFELESQFTDDWLLSLSHRRNEQQSSLISASYDQNTYGIFLRYQF